MRERNFLYKKKSYSFDLDLFITYSSYFSLNGEKLNDHDFFLLTEYDYRSNLSDEHSMIDILLHKYFIFLTF